MSARFGPRGPDALDSALRGDPLTISLRHNRVLLSSALLVCFAVAGLPRIAAAQEKHVAQTAGVDNNKMGPYRALAQLAYAAFQKGDVAAAAQLAKILERVWDKAEDYGGDTALKHSNPQVFDQVDKAMDEFITPLVDSKAKAPDPARVKATYAAYIEKLKLAD
jgi:hypothetical protein